MPDYWINVFGGAGEDVGYEVTTDSLGNIIISRNNNNGQ